MADFQEFRAAIEGKSSEDIPIRGFLHAGDGPDGLVLTHGAGADCRSPLLVTFADTFSTAGLTVLRCDLPFRQSRRHGPPPRGSAQRDQQGLRAAIASLHPLVAGRIFLGGHSYGGRQTSMLAASDPGLAAGLLLLSYPLHPPRRPEDLRTSHFPHLHTPTLFAHGAHDGFGTIAEMAEALALIPASTQLLRIPGAGHELITKRNGDQMPQEVLTVFRSFFANTV